MKLILLITAFTFQVSAAVLGQQVTLNVKNASLKEVMQNVRKQSGYYFFFESDYLKNARPVTVNLKESPIDKALQTIFKDQPFEYAVDGKMITLRPKEKDFQEQIKDVFLAITIRGRVVDADGNPLPGASVKAGNRTTITGAEGNFELSDIDESSTVEVSYIGYTSVTVPASSKFMAIRLSQDAADLQEVVVNKGYYTTQQELNTGSVVSVKGSDIAKQPISNPLIGLQGRVAGLYISEGSGVVGTRPNITLRGLNSIHNGTEPLYIVNGIPFDSKSLSQLPNSTGLESLSPFLNIRPGDIESVEVLKDADATAIYGSRGANGVILITTRKGHAGKTTINLDIYRGAAVVSRKLNLLNTQQYLEMRQEANLNDQVQPLPNEYDINGVWSKTDYTDWQRVLVGETANTTDVKSSITGGNENTNFLLTAGYRKEGMIYPGDFGSTIKSGNLSVTHSSNDKRLSVDLTAGYSVNDYNLPTASLEEFIYLPPNTPAIYDRNGNINWANNTFQNPLALLYRKSTTKSKNLLTSANLKYNIFNELTASVKLGYNTIDLGEENVVPYTSYMPLQNDDPVSKRRKDIGFNERVSTIIEPQINYSKTFGKHHIESLAGLTFNDNITERTVETTSGYGNDEQIGNSAYASYTRNLNYNTQYKYSALYVRFGYNFDSKYIINLTARRDGSSRFGPENRFGNFGSIGLAWNFAKERAIAEAIPILSTGKLRSSIGSTGNDQFGDYEYISAYQGGLQYFGITTFNPFRVTNPNFKWERINKFEAAIELGISKNRFLLNVNYFRNRTDNQLVGYPLPRTTGFSIVRANLPAVIQNTGIEIELLSKNLTGQDFQWTTSANITVPKNKLVSYPNLEASSNASFYVVGQPLTINKVYTFTGIDPQTGVYTFLDVDKNGEINLQDTKAAFVGQKFFGGVSNSLSYKGINVDFLFQFVKQTKYKLHSNRTAGALYFDYLANQPVEALNRWRQPNDVSEFQRFASVQTVTSAFTASENYLSSDDMLVDASFVRLKTLNISYSLPQKWISPLKVTGSRLYIQGQNLLTITGFKGADPENAPSRGTTPQVAPLRVFSAGIQLTL